MPSYNVPGVTAQLKFTGPLLADIFLGKITKWNDPAIAKVNPGVALPSTNIAVVHRSDGSGTTYIWVDYLSKVSPEWKQKVGVATSVNWPVGLGGPGNEGVAGLVKQHAGGARVRRADLRAAEQHRVRRRAEHGRRIRECQPPVGHGGGGGGSDEDAGGLPRVDRQRGGQGRLSHLVVHVDAAL